MYRLISIITFVALIIASPGLVHAEKRVALVIGNGDYLFQLWPDLDNPPNDAQDIAATLRDLGFELIGGQALLDLDKQAMERAITSFGEQLQGDTVGMFYFAGHGIAVNNTNYLVPTDSEKLTRKSVSTTLISANLILDQIPENSGLSIVILDACRNTPSMVRGVRGGSGAGLADMKAPSGTLISYATNPGNFAMDGLPGSRNSPFASALIENMKKKSVSVLNMFNNVGVDVEASTNGFQRPWLSSSPVKGNFYFAGLAPDTAITTTAQQNSLTTEMLFWQSIQNSQSAADYEAYLSQYADGSFAPLARVRIASLTTGPAVALKKPSEAILRSDYTAGDTFRDCEDCPEMVVIPAGSFQMGDLSGEGKETERPVHRVTIPRMFAVGKFEVTQAQWKAVLGKNPSYFKGTNLPAEQVSWDDVQQFIGKLNVKTGQPYRLLSESEFEYVARAGTTTKYSFGNSITSNQANFNRNIDKTTPVGNYPSNRFGVHDMHGNLWEWVEDCYENNYNNAPSNGSALTGSNSCRRVLRGGSWDNGPEDLRSSYRNGSTTDSRFDFYGFRIARTLP